MEIKENRSTVCSLISTLSSSAKYFASEAARVEYIYASITDAPTSDEIQNWHQQDQQHVAFVMASVMCAYSYAEAFVNSAIQQASMPNGVNKTGIEPSQAEAIRAALARASSEQKVPFASSNLLRKCNAFLQEFLSESEISRSESVYLDMEVLRELRHAIAHHSSEWESSIDGDVQKSHKVSDNERLAQSLRDRGIFALAFYESNDGAEFPRAYLTATCADWCCKTAESFVERFRDISQIEIESAQYSSSSRLYLE